MRTVSEERHTEFVTAEVYMRSIMEELGVTSPAEALEAVRQRRAA